MIFFVFYSQSLMERRQFFHSQTGQPMAPEQVFAEEDSEDEVDDERLDRFKDVSQHEKRLMLLWNSFMRKQRFWTLFMIKLWNHGLLDAKTMNNCRCILNSQNPENKN
ncbi:putative polycomb protein, VEFS-Box [Helianthus annuus]|nr:putative polycomb protein, VEFS-Box [Helianthus annuus]